LADAVYRDALATHGFDGCMRILTCAGSIVIRFQTEEETAVMEQTAEKHRRETPDKALGAKNADEAMNRALRATVLTDLAHFDKVTTRYHGIWRDIWAARNALVDGRVRTEGKGAAS
jgi:hypothetical protein